MDSFIPEEQKIQITNMDELKEVLNEGRFITTYINDVHLDYDEFVIEEDVIVFCKNNNVTAAVKIDDIRFIASHKIVNTGEAQ